jgi:hypothetical protein
VTSPPLRRRFLAVALGLALASPAAAQLAPPAYQRVQDLIELTQSASPYRFASPPSAQWCFTARSDLTYNRWYMDDVVGAFGAVPVRNVFTVPFVLGTYGQPRVGALVVGYAVDGGPPIVPLAPAAPPVGAAECSVGATIFVAAPYPVNGIAQDLALQTMSDPAPEYRYWPVLGHTRRVRFILEIPVGFAVGADVVAGRIIVGFTGDG